MIGAISTALSGLIASTKKVEASASNIANISSSGSLDPASPDQPYRTQTTVQTTTASGGVQATNIPKTPGIVNAYAPDSPFANSQGLVATPDTDLAEEAVNLKVAELSYKANLATLRTADEMDKELLKTFDEQA